MARKTMSTPLADIEFESATTVLAYGNTMRTVGRGTQLELHTAADELQAVLTNSTGSVLDRAKARRKAKKVSNHLRRAADHARGIAVEGVRMQRDFKKEYSELINPPKQKKSTFDWKG